MEYYALVLGSCAYVLHSALNDNAFQNKVDYIQTGESSIGAAAVVVFSIIFDNPFMILALTAFSISIYFYFVRKFIASSAGSWVFTGLCAHSVFAVILYYFYANFEGMGDLAGAAISGNWEDSGFAESDYILIFTFLMIIVLLLKKFEWRIKLYSFGSFFSINSSVNYPFYEALLSLARGIILGIVVFFTGCFAAYPSFLLFKNRSVKYAAGFVISFVKVAFFVYASHYIGRINAGLIAVFLSYFIFVLINVRRVRI